MAKQCDMSSAQVCQYEKGRSRIGISNLNKFAKALGCTIEEIDERVAKESAAEEKKRNRYIVDDILLMVVDAWNDAAPEAKVRAAALITESATANLQKKLIRKYKNASVILLADFLPLLNK